ncbi:MAG: wax ester/triacylglycerol synthase family O-acyltransferase [Isosphaeraceae bacterium]
MDLDHSRDVTLSPLDAACLRIEDRTSLIVNAGAMVFDGPLDDSKVREVLRTRLLAFRRFRQRVVPSGFPLGLPRWEDDRLFDLGSHVHRIALPSPGDDQVLREVLSDLISTPLDHARPLWEVHLIENHGAGSVVFFRIHHALADGRALLRVLRSLTDRKGPVEPGESILGAPEPPGEPDPSPEASRTTGTAEDILAETEALLHRAITLLFHPGQVQDLAGSASDAAASLGHLLTLSADSATPYKGPLGVAKRVAWSNPVPMSRIKAVAKASGASANQVILCAIAGAIRRDLERRGLSVCDLTFRVSIPVSMWRNEPADRLGNRFSLNLLELPVDRGDPRERLAVLRERLERLRLSAETDVMYGLMQVFGMLPPEVGNPILGLLNRKVTAVLSVVPGLPRVVGFAGRPVERMIFWVPQSGRLGLGLSVLPYRGAVTLGVAGDAGLMPDPGLLAAAFEDELNEPVLG